MSSFSAHIQQALEKTAFTRNQRLIIAVSGGADSMALLHACADLKLDCIAAHVNYGLRGADSDADEQCVRNYCASANLLVEVLRVRKEHWDNHPGSTQEAARQFRYAWFEELLRKYSASFIVTAHHANDQLETMLHQFIRGGGGKSLYGMARQQGRIVRPMLGISKGEILEYAQMNSIRWREDATNETNDYTRNFIRHEIIPSIEKVNPSILKSLQQRSEWMHQEQAAANEAVNSFLGRHLVLQYQTEKIAASDLEAIQYADLVLWKWLQSKGFSSQQVIQISALLQSESSTEAALVSSESHDVFIQNGTVACAPKRKGDAEHIHELPWSNDSIRIDICSREDVSFTRDATRQYLAIDQMTLPFVIREWQHGDVFFPLGAPGKQKVSDFLTHAKAPAWEKRNTLVLVSDTTIVAVLGMRICENFKIKDSTKECLRIQFSAERNLSLV